MRPALILGLACATPMLLVAQRPAQPPAAPTVVPAVAPADAGFRAWSTGRESDPPTFAPPRAFAGRFDVVLLPSRLRESAIGDSLHAAFARMCRVSLPNSVMSDADSLLASLDAWAAFDEAAGGTPLVAIQATPTRVGASDCGARAHEQAAGLMRGVRFGSDTFYSAASDARAAELWVNGSRVEPTLAASVPVIHVSANAVWRDSTRQVRLYVPADVFAPVEGGGWPRAELRVWSAAGEVPTIVPLPRAMLERVWVAELGWRAARLPERGTATARATLPAARDADVRRATEAFTRGALRDAASIAVGRLDAVNPLAERDRRVGRLTLAFALEEGGDEPATRAALGLAATADPCLTLGQGFDPRLVRALDDTRPPARCDVPPMHRVAVRALVPGFAQVTGGRRSMGYAVAAIVAGSIGFGYLSESSALAKYDEYEKLVNANPQDGSANFATVVERYHREATELRERGNTLRTVGLAVWVLGGLEAMLAERRHAARVRDVTGVGTMTSARVSVTPLPTTRGFGLLVSIPVGAVR